MEQPLQYERHLGAVQVERRLALVAWDGTERRRVARPPAPSRRFSSGQLRVALVLTLALADSFAVILASLVLTPWFPELSSQPALWLLAAGWVPLGALMYSLHG